MKLVNTGDYVPGVLVDGGVIHLSDALGSGVMSLPAAARMPFIIEHWNELRNAIADAAARGTPERTFALRSPLPRPGKMIFARSNYREGLETLIPAPFDAFLKAPSTVLDPGGEIELPHDDAQLFFHEAELGVVIGKRGRHVTEQRAFEHVFGYCCVNDVSSYGLPGMIGGMHNKNFDTFCPIGPCITTADEITDPHDLAVKLWVDGDLRQNYVTSDMEHRIPSMIAWCTRISTLESGDVLACGTNHDGIGPIQHGETIRLEIEGLGAIENRVRDPLGRQWPKGPDPQFSTWVRENRTTGKPTGPIFSVWKLNAGVAVSGEAPDQ